MLAVTDFLLVLSALQILNGLDVVDIVCFLAPENLCKVIALTVYYT